MNKIHAAREKLAQFLSNHEGTWAVDAIWRQIGNFDDMLPYHIRRAAKLLPEGCVTRRGGKLILSARYFAKPEEVVAALKALPNWEDDLPVLLQSHYSELRTALVLTNDWALHQSLEWAAPGNFEIGYYSYGQYVRWSKR